MSLDVSTIDLKFKRADKHFLDFKAALGFGSNPKESPYSAAFELKDNGTVEFSTDAPIPGPEFSIILGDGIHQLRSCLDHLVCLAAMRRHARSICEDSKLSFPITKNSADFDNIWQVQKGVLSRNVGADAFGLIQDAQPYKRNRLHPARDPLYILSKLDNIDKHRIVIIFNQALTSAGFLHQEGLKTPFDVTQKVKPGTQVLDFGITLIPDKPVAVEFHKLSQFITLAETDGICDGERVFPLIRDMQRAVAEVISDFAGLT
jgi:hypothetical protein